MTVSSRYGARAAEYCEALGSLDQMEPTDIALITSWGASVPGSILDAGCGPGHWARLLASADRSVTGIDVTPEFIAHARAVSSAPILASRSWIWRTRPMLTGLLRELSPGIRSFTRRQLTLPAYSPSFIGCWFRRRPSSGDVSGRARFALRTRRDNRLLCERSRVFRTVREGRVYGGRSSHPPHREVPRPPGDCGAQAKRLMRPMIDRRYRHSLH